MLDYRSVSASKKNGEHLACWDRGNNPTPHLYKPKSHLTCSVMRRSIRWLGFWAKWKWNDTKSSSCLWLMLFSLVVDTNQPVSAGFLAPSKLVSQSFISNKNTWLFTTLPTLWLPTESTTTFHRFNIFHHPLPRSKPTWRPGFSFKEEAVDPTSCSSSPAGVFTGKN